ncbi:MAG: hypothetical protein KGJ62_15180 [Armatimonadetes bacterium]|nr:hypothetical protein [Armatimonadota bacterium]MDE2206289.1 hypothetical protein [Armatimonadota bacterium]
MADGATIVRQGEIRDLVATLTAPANLQLAGTPLFFLFDETNQPITSPIDFVAGQPAATVAAGPAGSIQVKYTIDCLNNLWPAGYYTGSFRLQDTSGHIHVCELTLYIAPAPNLPWSP